MAVVRAATRQTIEQLLLAKHLYGRAFHGLIVA